MELLDDELHNVKSTKAEISSITDFNVANLFSSLPSLHRADGEAESGSTRDVWNVHVVVQPLVPPGTNGDDGVNVIKPHSG